MITLGNKDINEIMLGDKQVLEVYKGETLVWTNNNEKYKNVLLSYDISNASSQLTFTFVNNIQSVGGVMFILRSEPGFGPEWANDTNIDTGLGSIQKSINPATDVHIEGNKVVIDTKSIDFDDVNIHYGKIMIALYYVISSDGEPIDFYDGKDVNEFFEDPYIATFETWYQTPNTFLIVNGYQNEVDYYIFDKAIIDGLIEAINKGQTIIFQNLLYNGYVGDNDNDDIISLVLNEEKNNFELFEGNPYNIIGTLMISKSSGVAYGISWHPGDDLL